MSRYITHSSLLILGDQSIYDENYSYMYGMLISLVSESVQAVYNTSYQTMIMTFGYYSLDHI